MNGLKEQRYGPGPVGFNPFEDEEDRRFVPVPEAVKTDMPYGPGPVGFNPFEGEEIPPQREVAPEQVRGLKPAKAGFGLKPKKGYLAQKYEIGEKQAELGDLEYQQIWEPGLIGSPEREERIKELERTMPKVREPKHIIEHALGAAAQLAPIPISGMKKAATYGPAAGLGVAAIPGGQPFALPAAGIGAAYGFASDIFKKEAGLAYNELKKEKDPKTGEHLNPTIAKVTSLSIGAANAALEFWQATTLAKSFPGKGRIITEGVKATIRKLSGTPLRKLLFQASATYGKTAAKETLQEIMQETVNITGNEAAKILNNALKDTDIPPTDLKEIANRLKETATESLLAFSVFSLPGPAAQVATGLPTAFQKEKVAPPTEPTDLLGPDSADKTIFKDIESAIKKGAIPPEEYPNIIAELRERGLGSTKEVQKLEELFRAQAQIEEPIDLTEVVERPLEEVVEEPPVAPEEAMFVEPEAEAVIEEEIVPEEIPEPELQATIGAFEVWQKLDNRFEVRKEGEVEFETNTLDKAETYIKLQQRVVKPVEAPKIPPTEAKKVPPVKEKVEEVGEVRVETPEEIKQELETFFVAPEKEITRTPEELEAFFAEQAKKHKVTVAFVKAVYDKKMKAKAVEAKPIPEAKEEPTTQEIDKAAEETEIEPTEAQIEAGNYRMAHIKLQGFDISIENPKGSLRSGVDRQGKKWSQKLKHHYGYIKGTVGKDKDHLDVFIGPNPESDKIFVIDQVNPTTGKFDEHKIMMGFPTVQQARVGYLANYERAWKGLGEITELTVDEFKEWTEEGDTTKAMKLGKVEKKPSVKVEAEIPTLVKQGNELASKLEEAGLSTDAGNISRAITKFGKAEDITMLESTIKTAQAILEKKKPTPEVPSKAITYKTKIKVEETGEIVEITMDAEQAIKDIDKKIEVYKKLIHCLG